MHYLSDQISITGKVLPGAAKPVKLPLKPPQEKPMKKREFLKP